MGKVFCTLTVFFEEPFYVGVFERNENGRLCAARVVFGAEPKDCEILDFLLKHYCRLRFGPQIEAAVKEKHPNPKRAQRGAKKQLSVGIGTKAMQALKLSQEQSKQTRKAASRERKAERAARIFSLKQQKKKDKRRGH